MARTSVPVGLRLTTAPPRTGSGILRRALTSADRAIVVEVLRASFLSGIGAPALERFAHASTLAIAPSGALLYGPTEHLDAVAVVIDGLTRDFALAGDGRHLTIAYGRPGSPVSLSALAGGREALLWIQALVPTTVVEIPVGIIEEAAAADPSIGLALAAELQGLIVDGMEALAMAASGSFRSLLAFHLLRLAEATRRGEALVVPIGQRDLAEIVGTAREVVARALRSLREEGIVHTQPSRIAIDDPVRLASIAGRHRVAT